MKNKIDNGFKDLEGVLKLFETLKNKELSKHYDLNLDNTIKERKP